MNPSGEKTEQATPRRLIKARREGQFASSHDFVSGLQFTVFVVLIAQTGPALLASLKEVTRGMFVEAFRGDSSKLAALIRENLHKLDTSRVRLLESPEAAIKLETGRRAPQPSRETSAPVCP